MHLFKFAFALSFVLGIFFSPKINAQKVMDDGNWEAVILYNSVPYLVDMTPEGKILEFKKELPVFFGELQAYIEEEFGDNPIRKQEVIVAENMKTNTSDEPVEADVELSIPSKSSEIIETTELIKPIQEDLVEETEIDTLEEMVKSEEGSDNEIILERKEFHYNLIYPGQIAVFNQGQLSRLDEIINVLNDNPELKFSMRAYASDNSAVSETVNTNRLTGIADYLKVKGIKENRIISEGLALDPEKSNTIHIKLY